VVTYSINPIHSDFGRVYCNKIVNSHERLVSRKNGCLFSAFFENSFVMIGPADSRRKTHMNISSTITHRPASAQTAAQPKAEAQPTQQQTLEDKWAEQDKAWNEFHSEWRDHQKGSTIRGLAVGAASVAALGAAGYYLGNLTGVGGAIAGGALGLAGGVTVGGLAGSWAGNDKGSSGLAYLGIGVVAGAAVGAIGGGFAGMGALPIAGAVAGGLGGVATGFYAHSMLEDSAHNKLMEKHGLAN
jgi:hypothetical protein